MHTRDLIVWISGGFVSFECNSSACHIHHHFFGAYSVGPASQGQHRWLSWPLPRRSLMHLAGYPRCSLSAGESSMSKVQAVVPIVLTAISITMTCEAVATMHGPGKMTEVIMMSSIVSMKSKSGFEIKLSDLREEVFLFNIVPRNVDELQKSIVFWVRSHITWKLCGSAWAHVGLYISLHFVNGDAIGVPKGDQLTEL